MDTNKPTVHQRDSNALTKSFENLNTFEDVMELAEKLVSMDSKLVPFKKAGDVVIVLQAARDFKIPITFALANIHPIQGKASAGVHLLSAQILNAGITYKVIEDFAPIYEYSGLGKIPVTHDEFVNNPDKYHLIGVKTPETHYHKEKLNVIRVKEIDRRTVIEFKRWVLQPNGKYELMIVHGRFSRSEARLAGLYESNPKTWGRYERAMIYARAFGDGSKKIGNDVLLGMTEVSMMCDTFNIPYVTDKEGNVIPDLSKAGITKSDDAEDVNIEIIEE